MIAFLGLNNKMQRPIRLEQEKEETHNKGINSEPKRRLGFSNLSIWPGTSVSKKSTDRLVLARLRQDVRVNSIDLIKD